jgi:S-(hydroxymethyl)glutathione dehydrogenase/alcohol dehydrogenase
VQAARIVGASRIIAVDPVPDKRELARRLGATDVLDSNDPNLVRNVIALADGIGVDHAIEAVGRAETIQQGFSMTRRGGITTVVGLVPAGSNVEIPTDELFYERRLQGSVMGSNDFKVDVPRYLQMYLDEKLNLDDMVSERIGLDAINEGFDLMKAGRTARVLVEFN